LGKPRDIINLMLTPVTEGKLWAHGIALADALSVLDGQYETFMNPRNSERRLLIGLDRSQHLLALVVERTDDKGIALLITGWPSSPGEASRFVRAGGTRYG
jgi:hypothetical protein